MSFIFKQRIDLELFLQVALHTAYVKELDLLPYLALTTTTGAVQLWQGNIVQWTREEGLSRLQVAEMAELPEQKTIAARIIDRDETFAERARRQVADAKVRFFRVRQRSIVNVISGVTPVYLPLYQEVYDGFLRLNPSACSASLPGNICS